LLSAALAAGVALDEGAVVRRPLVDESGGMPVVTGVVVEHAGKRMEDARARVTIAADGRRSAVALALGLLRHPPRPRRWAIGAYFEGVTGLTSYGEMHIRPRCYLGVAPLPGSLANACYVSADRFGHEDPAGQLISALREDQLLAPRFRSARMVSAPMVLGPLAVDVRTAGVPGLLLAGDAAGFVDPMTGDGLRFAIRGAELAARVAGEMLADGSLEGHLRLAALRAAEFTRKQRFNRTLRTLVASPCGVAVASRAAGWAPGLIRRLIRIAGDAA
jgi:flavin-dependent dehydrogenase